MARGDAAHDMTSLRESHKMPTVDLYADGQMSGASAYRRAKKATTATVGVKNPVGVARHRLTAAVGVYNAVGVQGPP